MNQSKHISGSVSIVTMKMFGDFCPNILFDIAYIVSQKKLHPDSEDISNKFLFQNNGCPGKF